MDKIESIKTKIVQIERIIDAIKNELEILGKYAEGKPKKVSENEPLPSNEQLRSDYENLYTKFVESNSKAIEDFIKNKSKNYLKAFCKANNLPVDTSKVSKDSIVREVFQWMAQRKAITKKAT